jgi:hypothetical protein
MKRMPHMTMDEKVLNSPTGTDPEADGDYDRHRFECSYLSFLIHTLMYVAMDT